MLRPTSRALARAGGGWSPSTALSVSSALAPGASLGRRLDTGRSRCSISTENNWRSVRVPARVDRIPSPDGRLRRRREAPALHHAAARATPRILLTVSIARPARRRRRAGVSGNRRHQVRRLDAKLAGFFGGVATSTGVSMPVRDGNRSMPRPSLHGRAKAARWRPCSSMACAVARWPHQALPPARQLRRRRPNCPSVS